MFEIKNIERGYVSFNVNYINSEGSRNSFNLDEFEKLSKTQTRREDPPVKKEEYFESGSLERQEDIVKTKDKDKHIVTTKIIDPRVSRLCVCVFIPIPLHY